MRVIQQVEESGAGGQILGRKRGVKNSGMEKETLKPKPEDRKRIRPKSQEPKEVLLNERQHQQR